MLLFVAGLLISVCSIIALPVGINNLYPQNEMEHFKTRDEMIEEEKQFEKRNWQLSEDEVIVDQFLAYLKWKDFKHFGKSEFPPLMPIQTIMARAQDTELYKYLVGLPKGGNLHSHEDHQLSRKILFDIVWDSDDFKDLYIVLDEGSPNAWMMDFFINPPTDENWVKVKDSNVTKEETLKRNTLIGLMTINATNNPTDSSLRWELINNLWMRGSTQLISNINIKKRYLWEMLKQSISEGITYLETRRSLGLDLPMYMLDSSGSSNATFGKMFLDFSYELEVSLAQEVAKNFSSKYSRFIGLKRISYAVRAMDINLFADIINITLRLHDKYPDHVIGFDAVGEEDAGYASIHYLKQYVSLYDNGKSKLPLFLHSVETSWPEDILTSEFDDELLPTLENGYDNLILMAKRVGHGKGFIKKPYLREILKSRDTAVEVCVISNQILGMEPDIRNHYGQVLYKEGIPIVLAPDDPGTFGTDNATLDWYMVYLGWGLGLGDLKKIAKNSLTYSGMSDSEKKDAIDNKWTPSWDEYITKMKNIACAYDFKNSANPIYRRVYPNPLKKDVNAHIFGRNFERAICQTSKCKFGSEVVDAIYISNQHLTCIVPACTTECTNVSLYVSLGLDNFQETKLTLNYLSASKSSRPLEVSIIVALLGLLTSKTSQVVLL